jgi:dipeptidyl aminopeptidase/acylaminoacyl peptidase
MTKWNSTAVPRARRIHAFSATAAMAFAILAGVADAATTPAPASAFAETPVFSHVALSPDGRTIAMDRSTADGLKVVMHPVGSTEPLRVLNVGENTKLRGLRWADARTLLIDLSATVRVAGAPRAQANWEFWRTMAASLDGGAPQLLLMDDETRKYVTGAEVLAAGPKRPGIVTMAAWDYSGARQGQSIGTRLHDERRDSGWVNTLFDVDTTTGKGRVVDRGTPFTSQWLVKPDGTPLARSEWQPAKKEFSVLARDGSGWRVIHQQSGYDWLDLAGTTSDGKALVAVGENGTDRARAWSLPLAGGPATVLHEDPDGDVSAAITDPDSGIVVGVESGGLEPRQHWFEPERAARQRALAKAFPGREVRVTDRSSDRERVLVIAESRSHPPVVHLVDFGAGRADTVGEFYPDLVGVQLGESRAISYLARDGASIPAYLTLPPGREAKQLPVVVMPHGGPESRDTSGFDWMAQFLATRGYAVLQPQFRGSTGFGRAHRLAGYGEWGGRMQDDLSDGVRHLVATGVADPRRVCIAGASYGGYAALAGAAFTPDLYACAVSVNGVSDLPTMIGDLLRRGDESSDSVAYWKDHIGPPTNPQVAARSPARAAASVRAQVLLLHGANDTVVPPSQSQLMAKALAEAGKPHRYVELPGEDHWLSSGAMRTRALEEIESFLAQHLGPAGARAGEAQSSASARDR